VGRHSRSALRSALWRRAAAALGAAAGRSHGREDYDRCCSSGADSSVCALAEQCPWSEDVPLAAALHCQLGTVRWLLEHGCPWYRHGLWLVAARTGSMPTLSYLLQLAGVPEEWMLTGLQC
jgi:hypothetical protein